MTRDRVYIQIKKRWVETPFIESPIAVRGGGGRRMSQDAACAEGPAVFQISTYIIELG